jgi:hypothetical protein
MTTTKIAGYSYDALTNTLTMTASFAKKASQLNTPEYKILLQLRLDNPGMKIEKATPKASSNRPVSIPFAKMEEYIAQCRDSKERLTAFDKVKALSKIQASPYSYVRTWFLDNYANYSEQPEFDEDGFMTVKTRAELEAELLAQKEENESEAKVEAALEIQEP